MKEVISNRQIFVVMFTMIVSGILSLGGTSGAGRNAWLSAIFVIVLAIPLYFIYFYPIKINKGKDFFEINELLYGIELGKVVNVVYLAIILLITVVSFSRYTVFVKAVALEQTSVVIIGVFMLITVIYATFCGFEVIARFAEIAVIVISIFLAFTLILSISAYDASNVTPIIEDGVKPVLDGALAILITPYAEAFAFVCLLSNVKDRNSVSKTLNIAICVSGVVMSAIFLRNLMILGYPMVENLYYPSYQAISVISLGSFFQRQEVTVSATFLIADIIRLSILSIFLCKGINFIAKKRNYKKYSTAVGFIVFVISIVFLSTTVKLFNFLDVYKVIIGVSLLILPTISCVLSFKRIKKRTV